MLSWQVNEQAVQFLSSDPSSLLLSPLGPVHPTWCCSLLRLTLLRIHSVLASPLPPAAPPAEFCHLTLICILALSDCFFHEGVCVLAFVQRLIQFICSLFVSLTVKYDPSHLASICFALFLLHSFPPFLFLFFRLENSPCFSHMFS